MAHGADGFEDRFTVRRSTETEDSGDEEQSDDTMHFASLYVPNRSSWEDYELLTVLSRMERI